MRTSLFLLIPLLCGANVAVIAADKPKVKRHHGPCLGWVASHRCTTCENCVYCGKKGERKGNSATCPACEDKPKPKR